MEFVYVFEEKFVCSRGVWASILVLDKLSSILQILDAKIHKKVLSYRHFGGCCPLALGP
jgi:hypothetical protein